MIQEDLHVGFELALDPAYSLSILNPIHVSLDQDVTHYGNISFASSLEGLVVVEVGVDLESLSNVSTSTPFLIEGQDNKRVSSSLIPQIQVDLFSDSSSSSSSPNVAVEFHSSQHAVCVVAFLPNDDDFGSLYSLVSFPNTAYLNVSFSSGMGSSVHACLYGGETLVSSVLASFVEGAKIELPIQVDLEYTDVNNEVTQVSFDLEGLPSLASLTSSPSSLVQALWSLFL